MTNSEIFNLLLVCGKLENISNREMMALEYAKLSKFSIYELINFWEKHSELNLANILILIERLYNTDRIEDVERLERTYINIIEAYRKYIVRINRNKDVYVKGVDHLAKVMSKSERGAKHLLDDIKGYKMVELNLFSKIRIGGKIKTVVESVKKDGVQYFNIGHDEDTDIAAIILYKNGVRCLTKDDNLDIHSKHKHLMKYLKDDKVELVAVYHDENNARYNMFRDEYVSKMEV